MLTHYGCKDREKFGKLQIFWLKVESFKVKEGIFSRAEPREQDRQVRHKDTRMRFEANEQRDVRKNANKVHDMTNPSALWVTMKVAE